MTMLRPDDPRIERLLPEDAAELRATMSATDPAARDARLAAWMTSIGLPPTPPGTAVTGRRIVDRRDAGDRAREIVLLLSEIGIDLSRYPVYSQSSWLRRWLGVEPPGLLFREIDDGGTRRTLLEAVRARTANELAALLATLPVAERVELLVELLDGGQDYSATTAAHALATAIRELDATGGAWASRAADAALPPPVVKHFVGNRERAIFVALARANVPVEPRWDALVPLSYGSFARWSMEESLAAIPPERRASAVIARLGRAGGTENALFIATEALSIVPDPSIARWALDRWEDQGRPKAILDAMRALAAEHPALRDVVAGAEKPPSLVPRAVAADALDDVTRAQREALGRSAEKDEPAPGSSARRYVLDRDGTPSLDVWLVADSGIVFRAGTTDVVAEIVQGGIESADASLRRELRIALAAARDLRPPKPASRAAPKPRAKKKPPA